MEDISEMHTELYSERGMWVPLIFRRSPGSEVLLGWNRESSRQRLQCYRALYYREIVLQGEAAPASPGRLHELISVEHIRVL